MQYLVVSDNHTFMISQFNGDIPLNETSLGLYYYDTRHLSGLRMRLNQQPLELLSSSDEHIYQATILLTNEASGPADDSDGPLRSQTIAIQCSRVVSSAIFERITITNYNRTPAHFELEIDMAADFADIFLVRGFKSGTRGHFDPIHIEKDHVMFSYQGADHVTRTTSIRVTPAPNAITAISAEAPPPAPGPQGEGANTIRQLPTPLQAQLRWQISLTPQAEQVIELCMTPSTSQPDQHIDSTGLTMAAALKQVRSSYAEWDAAATRITTDNPAFNELIRRSSHDMRALTASLGEIKLPIAGIPWFAVPFGRDSLIASLQTLSFQPELAKGTLRYLASQQGSRDDPWRDEHPGKILHEMRFGELANTNSVPFNPYYGSIDSTLLFLMLFAETIHWTGDMQLYHELLPAVLRALDWINTYADLDGDGYIEFQRRSEGGLRIQGWKDSWDSVLRTDGSLAEPPIALVEVQAYVYAAKTWIAELLQRNGDTARAGQLQTEAAALKQRFNQDFWLEEQDYYAQAIELGVGPLPEITSNPGHAFLSGILLPERAARMARRITRPDLASGWGIRTRAASDHNYNPMSYHNGSVWPHDNSLIISGLARSGFRDEANLISEQIFAAAQHFPLNRLPELMCGYAPEPGSLSSPAPYPVSCRPQAWAAGTALLILQSIVGLQARALDNTLRVVPHLPSWLQTIELQNLRIGEKRVHLRISKAGTEIIDDGGVQIESK